MSSQTAKREREYGRGSVYFSDSRSCWVGQVKLGTKPNGKPDVKAVYAKTENEAHRKLNAILNESAKVQYVYVQKQSVGDFLNLWATTVKRIELKDKSYDRLEQTINSDVIPFIGSIQLAALESLDVQKMLNTLQDSGRSYSSIKKAFDAVNASFKWGLSIKPPKVRENPCTGVKVPSKKLFKPTQIKFYTEEEARAITEAALKKYPCGTPHYPLGGAIVLVLNTGIRLGELMALEWNRDIDIENRTLTVHHTVVRVKDRTKEARRHYIVKEQESTKTDSGQDREIPLNDMALLALESLRIETGKFKYVLSTKAGNRKSARDIDKLMSRIVLRAGFPEEKVYGVHSLRHTFATLLLQRKVDIKTVSELLGHSSVDITYKTYIHVIKEQKRAAIASLPNIGTVQSNN